MGMSLRGGLALLMLALILALATGCNESTELVTPWSDNDIHGQGDPDVADGWRMVALSIDAENVPVGEAGSRTMTLIPGGDGSITVHSDDHNLTWSTTNGYLTIAVRESIIDILGATDDQGTFTFGQYAVTDELLTYIYKYDGFSVVESWVRGIDYGQISLPETSHDFGPVPTNLDSTWMLPISNDGTGPLTVFGLTSTAPGIFQVDNNASLTIDAGQSGELAVTFSPTQRVSYGPDTVYVASDDRDHPELYVVVRGEGDAPVTSIYFDPVEPTGDPFNVIVTGATLDGNELSLSSEIGLFDGDLCVGAGTVGENQWDDDLTVVAWHENTISEQPGFVDGHPIQFKIWDANGQTEYSNENATITPTYTVGGGTFGEALPAIVSLAITTTSQN